ncbi:MAG: 50S ribosomal protein L16 [Nanoarchaeota archaeon]|nr:50S ribosomal protein L16 [Nanoarchaeota archaeon]MBU1030423.1 50S ribosomal protein L16 [Nanoarchaeota archaeon]
MAKVRRAVAYRTIERPYTRTSKYRNKQFVRAKPHNKIVKFVMGNTKKEFLYTVMLKAKDTLQIRHQALESARLTSNRLLESKCGKQSYKLLIKPYPHHILRENPLAAGAGADRMSTGMQKAFGKPVGLAAQIKKGQILIEVSVDEAHIETARKAMNRAKHKFACSCSIEVKKN